MSYSVCLISAKSQPSLNDRDFLEETQLILELRGFVIRMIAVNLFLFEDSMDEIFQ